MPFMWISITISLLIIVICHNIYLHFQPAEYRPRVHSQKYNAIYDELIKIENDINIQQEPTEEEEPDVIPPPDRPAEAEISNL